MSKTLLELKNVSKMFQLESGRELEVLDNISIRLEENQTLALLGPSGSGKSTCLRIMCGLQTATKGSVIADGRDLEGINEDVSLVFQSFALFPWETIKRNVEIALHPLKLSPDELKRRVDSAVDIVGLSGFEEAYPRELSGGMKQRVGVARAIAMERAILFLDEPFSALDVLTADTLRDEIMKIYQSKKTKTRSLMVVTHNIQEAVIMADRILVMGSNPGRIRAEFVNDLDYPRNTESPAFKELVSRIHRTITETYIPDESAKTKERRILRPSVEPLPDVQLIEVVGILEAIHAEGDFVDVFVLSADIGKDFGRTLYLVKAAELLGLVDTPKQQVELTRDGKRFVVADVSERKQMLHDQFAKLFIVQKTTELLKQSPTVRIPIEDLEERMSQWLPNEDPKRAANTLVSWGRYAEYFGYNDDSKAIYLDIGQEVV